MREKFESRFQALINEGQSISSKSRKTDYGEVYGSTNEEVYSWVSSAINLIYAVTSESSPIRTAGDNYAKSFVNPSDFRKLLGVLISANNEWQSGMLVDMEAAVSAVTFDDFLDHAEDMLRGDEKNGAAVLVAVVFEDSLKKIAKKHKVNEQRTLEPILNDLIQREVLTALKGKKLKGFVGIRDKALHANWDQFDKNDVDQFLSVAREVITDYLQ